ncbi:MAG: DUF11 domain-containing protein [Planctomycetia bacterium]|nr:DUF11 domain-containing protein [Planctomycetia bacterium]
MRNRRVYRALAVTTVAVIAAATLAAVMRKSEADTPKPFVAAPAQDRAAEATATTDPNTKTGNRIRFGTTASSDTTAGGTPSSSSAVSGPIRVGNRYEGYAVRQAAAEEPIAESRNEPAEPFANNVPPVGAMPTPAPPLPPRAAMPPSTPMPTVAKPQTSAAAPASDSRYGTTTSSPAAASPYAPTVPTYTTPPANALPRAPIAAASTSTVPTSTASTTAASAPTSVTAAAPAPFSPAGSASTIPDRAPLPVAASSSTMAAATPPVNPASSVGSSTTTSSGVGGTGRPGEKALEGTQSPTLTIEKIAPQEIQVGKPALFEIVVRNVGGATAGDVEIRDLVPQGTQLKSSNPTAARGPAGELIWLLGAMKPGDEAKVQMELLPTTEGEIGSVATVRFAAAASVRTLCTKPELVVEVQMPRTVLAGDDVPVRIRVSNPGTGIATGIFLTEVVPAGMEHTAGGELEYEVGNLQPNESRELELTLRAVKQGSVVNIIQGEGDGTLRSETKTPIEIVAPALTLSIEGPKRRYLDRQATYTVSLANPGTAAAKEVELATFLPKGMQFVDADNHGEYDAATHSVRWLLEELPAKEKGSVSVTALPIEPGQQLLRAETTAARGVSAKQEEAIMIEGAASINFQVVDTADPIEVGGDTTYEIVVANQGSKEATNVQLTIALPEGMKALDADGPARFNIAARQVTFQPLAKLAPKQETTFRVRVQCVAAGDHRCHVQLTSDDMKTPVTKEEGTRVYADE